MREGCVMRNHNGRFTSQETERRRAWAAMRDDGRDASLPGIGNMTFVEHLGLLQRLLESMPKGNQKR